VSSINAGGVDGGGSVAGDTLTPHHSCWYFYWPGFTSSNLLVESCFTKCWNLYLSLTVLIGYVPKYWGQLWVCLVSGLHITSIANSCM